MDEIYNIIHNNFNQTWSLIFGLQQEENCQDPSESVVAKYGTWFVKAMNDFVIPKTSKDESDPLTNDMYSRNQANPNHPTVRIQRRELWVTENNDSGTQGQEKNVEYVKLYEEPKTIDIIHPDGDDCGCCASRAPEANNRTQINFIKA